MANAPDTYEVTIKVDLDNKHDSATFVYQDILADSKETAFNIALEYARGAMSGGAVYGAIYAPLRAVRQCPSVYEQYRCQFKEDHPGYKERWHQFKGLDGFVAQWQDKDTEDAH